MTGLGSLQLQGKNPATDTKPHKHLHVHTSRMDGNMDDVIDFARWRRRHDDFLWHGHVMNVRDGLVVVPW